MVEVKVIKQEPLTYGKIAELLKELDEKTLAPIQQKVKDFTLKCNKINKAQETKLLKELQELGLARMNEKQVVELINLLPKDINELKAIFANSKVMMTPENIQKIHETLKQYAN